MTQTATDTSAATFSTLVPEMKKQRPSADQIYSLAENIYEFRRDAALGSLYAIDKETRLAESLSTRGTFRYRISNLCRALYGMIPRGQTLSEAIDAMSGAAQEETPVQVHMRIAETSRRTWLDMADEDGHLIVIDADGWRVTDSTEFGTPVFRRPKSEKPMIMPEHVNSWEDAVKPLFNIVRIPADARRLAIGWIIYCLLYEARPFPILLLQAEQGSGKSTIMRTIVRLTAPDAEETGKLLPRNEEDFGIQAFNHRLLIFDNVSNIPPSKRDAMCKLSTGGALSKRTLYTDAEETQFQALRPTIVTAINLGTTSPDLNERIVRIPVPRIEPSERRTEQQLAEDWNEHKSTIFGGLLTLASRVRKRLDGDFNVPDLPRMADYGRVLAAIDYEFNLHNEDGHVRMIGLDAYRAQQQQMAIENVGDEPVWLALDLMAAKFAEPFTGSSGELLRSMQDVFNAGLQTWKKPPESANDLTKQLDIIAPPLRKAGWTIEHQLGTGRTSGTRIWTIQAPNQKN